MFADLLRVNDAGQWQPYGDVVQHMRPPDLGRISNPLYPPLLQLVRITSTTTIATNVYPGRVQRIDVGAAGGPTAVDAETCWVWSPSGATLPATYCNCRLNGVRTYGATDTRPLYTFAAPVGMGTGGGAEHFILSPTHPDTLNPSSGPFEFAGNQRAGSVLVADDPSTIASMTYDVRWRQLPGTGGVSVAEAPALSLTEPSHYLRSYKPTSVAGITSSTRKAIWDLVDATSVAAHVAFTYASSAYTGPGGSLGAMDMASGVPIVLYGLGGGISPYFTDADIVPAQASMRIPAYAGSTSFGWYLLYAACYFPSHAVGSNSLEIGVGNFSADNVIAAASSPGDAGSRVLSVSMPWHLVSGDFIRVRASQSSGGPLSIPGSVGAHYGLIYLGRV